MQTTTLDSPITQPTSNTHFRMMAFFMKARDMFKPRRNIVEEAHILRGDRVLDYGCGAGSYIPDVSSRVGKTGKVYALDAHPLSIKRIRSMTTSQRMANVETIHSDCKTGLPAESIDIILLYDVFHLLTDSESVLRELHRILKSNGNLSFSDHHLSHNDIVAGVTRSGLFSLCRQDRHTYCFVKSETP